MKDTEFYNAESALYSAKRYPELPSTFTQFFFKARLSRVLRLLAPNLSSRMRRSVLEIGCADGIVARTIYERFKSNIANFDAIDAASQMIRVAREKHADTPIRFLVREGSDLSGTYDLIIEVGVLNYVDAKVEYEAVRRALTAHGRYICSIAGSSSLQNRLKGNSGYRHLTSYREYERELEAYFRIERRIAIGFFIPLLWKVPSVARAIQPIIEWLGRCFAPSLALEKLYVLSPIHHV